MAINPDLSEPDSSKLLTTYQSPGQDMYQVTRPLVHPGAQITVLCSHIPKQSESWHFLEKFTSKSFAYYVITSSSCAVSFWIFKFPHVSNYYISTLKQDM